jgi:hypothetical protein
MGCLKAFMFSLLLCDIIRPSKGSKPLRNKLDVADTDKIVLHRKQFCNHLSPEIFYCVIWSCHFV